MNICFISPMSLPSVGGLQYVLHYWAVALSEGGHKVTLMTDTAEGNSDDTRQPYTIIRHASLAKQWRALRDADKILMFNISLKALPLCLLSRKPLYVSHHTALWYEGGEKPLRQIWKQWVANIFPKAQCACSQYIANLFHNCSVIFSPIRLDIFKPGKADRKPRSIVFAGRLVSDKGMDLLTDAVFLLAARGVEVSLTILGNGPDRQTLENQAKNKGLGTKIIFRGEVPQLELVEALQTHSIMVVPSRMEPMGMVVAEGLACGCTMVVARQGGLPEVGGSFCHYFQPEDVVSLADALQQAVEKPVVVDATALQQHLSQFTIEHSVRELEGMLKSNGQ